MSLLLDNNFDGETIGNAPSGWTRGGAQTGTVQSAPSGMSGKALRITQGTGSDYCERTYTRQTGIHEHHLLLRIGGVTNSRYGDISITDTVTGKRAVRLLFTTITVGADANAVRASNGGSYFTVASLAQSTTYAVIVYENVATKKWAVRIGGTLYDNGGAWWSFDDTGAGGTDKIQVEAASPEGATGGEYTWFDALQIFNANATQVTLTPATETDAAQPAGVTQASIDKYSVATLTVTGLAGTPTFERSANGSSWSDISAAAHVSITNNGGGSYTCVDKRPQYGPGSVAFGATVYYRINGGPAFQLTAAVNKQAIRTASYSTLGAIIDAGGGKIVSSPSWDVYVADWCMSMARAFWRTGTDAFRTRTMSQYAEVISYLNADNLLKFPDYTDHIYRDHHARTAAQLAATSRGLAYGGASSDSLTVLAKADAMAKAAIDKLALYSASFKITDANTQTALPLNSTVTAGDIYRPGTPNGHTYRVLGPVGQTFTTGASEPATWPTNTGGTVTKDGITYKETTGAGSVSYNTYAPTSTYGWATINVPDPNQHATEALMYALLVTDSRSDFYPAGAYRTAALQRITDNLKIVAACQFSSGSILLGSLSETDDTLYCGYTLLQCAGVYALMGAVIEELPLLIDRGLHWMQTRSGGSIEPLTRIGSGTIPSISELMYRIAAARAIGTTDPIDSIPYSAAFWLPSVDKVQGGYAVNGATAASHDGYQSLAWEAETYVDIIIGPKNLTPATETDEAQALTFARGYSITPAGETDAAVSITYTQPHRVTLTPATETDTAVGLSFTSGSHYVTLTPASEIDAAVAVSFTSGVHRKTITSANEIDQAVALSYTATGSVKAIIIRETYTTSDQFGSKTVESDTFGERTTYIHPESTIS